MSKILFNIPQKGDEEEQFLDILSREHGIDRTILYVLKKHLGENLYFVLNVLAGKIVKIPNVDNLDNICLEIRLYEKMKKMLGHNMDFDEIIFVLSKDFSISTNKIFRFYSEMKIHDASNAKIQHNGAKED